jgi:drug/metabolite transporter (DMT)-like permease
MTVSLTGVLFVCISAIAFSSLDLARKILVTRISGMTLLFYLSVGSLPFFAAWVALENPGVPAPGYLLPALGSVALNLVANLLFIEAVRISPLSLTVPFLAFAPVFTTLLGVPLLGENPRLVQWIGVSTVVAGALQLNRSANDGSALSGLWRALVSERGSVLMIVVALSWSLAMPFDKIALARADAAIHGCVLNVGVAAGLAAALLLRGRIGELGTVGRAGLLLPVAVLASVVGLAFLFLALGLVYAGIIETLRRAIGSVAALLLGRRFFAEPLTRGKLVAVALMSGGVALILL